MTTTLSISISACVYDGTAVPLFPVMFAFFRVEVCMCVCMRTHVYVCEAEASKVLITADVTR